MNANSMCVACMLNRQEKSIRAFTDEAKKSEYIRQVLKLLYDHAGSESTPWLSERLDTLYQSFWGEGMDYAPIKHKYNQLLLSKEAEVEQHIAEAADPVRECIKYVCAGNYIDFGAVNNVNEDTFEALWEKASKEQVSEVEYAYFQKDLAQAKKLVYLTDNCGEIVLDKVFIKYIKAAYPKLQVTVVVRGKNVINDATMEDAKEVGLTELVPCIGNGNGAPGTVMKNLSEEARRAISEADVVISKGQGNFESLCGEGINPYYFFLCKCALFVRRFGLKQYESVFMREERMRIG